MHWRYKRRPSETTLRLRQLHLDNRGVYATLLGRGIGWLLIAGGTGMVTSLTLLGSVWKTPALAHLLVFLIRICGVSVGLTVLSYMTFVGWITSLKIIERSLRRDIMDPELRKMWLSATVVRWIMLVLLVAGLAVLGFGVAFELSQIDALIG